MIEFILDRLQHSDLPLTIATIGLVHATDKLAHAENNNSAVLAKIHDALSWMVGKVSHNPQTCKRGCDA